MLIDSAVIPLFVDKKIGKASDFIEIVTGEYQLSSEGKAKIVKAVFDNLNEKVLWKESIGRSKILSRSRADRSEDILCKKKKNIRDLIIRECYNLHESPTLHRSDFLADRKSTACEAGGKMV